MAAKKMLFPSTFFSYFLALWRARSSATLLRTHLKSGNPTGQTTVFTRNSTRILTGLYVVALSKIALSKFKNATSLQIQSVAKCLVDLM